MENPNYIVPARYISSAAKLMELMMTQCGKHSKKSMAKELQIPLSTVDAWIRQVEITLNNKRLKEGRRVVFPYFSKESCHFCKFYPNAEENLIWTRGDFGLMHNNSFIATVSPIPDQTNTQTEQEIQNYSNLANSKIPFLPSCSRIMHQKCNVGRKVSVWLLLFHAKCAFKCNKCISHNQNRI